MFRPFSQNPVSPSHRVDRIPKVTFVASTTEPPTDSCVANTYSAGLLGGFTRCHRLARAKTSADGGAQTATPPLPSQLPEPEAVATARPVGLNTTKVIVKSRVSEPLFQTSTEGRSTASADGFPRSSQVMLPVTLLPAA